MSDTIELNNSAAWDIAKKIGDAAENDFAKLLGETNLEVKSDRFKNNRIFIEVFKETQAGRLDQSGLYTSECNQYVLVKNHMTMVVERADLVNLVYGRWASYYAANPGSDNYSWLTRAGDGKRSLGILVTLEEIIEYTNRLRLLD